MTMAENGELWRNLLPTLEETVGGLLLGLMVGICGGVLMARSRFAATVLDPYVIGINGLPRVALGPFFVVWFGIGILSKVLLAVSIVFVVVLFNTREKEFKASIATWSMRCAACARADGKCCAMW